jgi:phage terminase large subunit-like protein
MSLISGLLSVQNADTDDLTGEWQQHVTVRHAKGIGSGAVLFALMTMLRKENAESTEYNWFERDPVRQNYYSNAAFTSSVTTLTFDDGSGNNVWQGLSLNTVIENSRTGEYVRVTADPTSASVAVERGHAGTTAAAINNADLWSRLFVSAEEGSLPTRAVYENPQELKNFIETFNSSIFLTNAFKGTVLRSDMEGPLRERRIYALEKICGDIEKAFLLGRRNRLVGTNGYIYQTGGIRDAIQRAGLSSTNILNGNGAGGCTLANFKAWLRSFMVFGSNQKIALCGPLAYSALSDYANTAAAGFRIMNNETVFGMNITTIVTPFGILEMTFHPLLQEMAAYQASMFVIDMPNLVQKTMEPLFLERNIQTRGQDAYQEQFRAKLGMKLKFANAFGHAYNLQLITT